MPHSQYFFTNPHPERNLSSLLYCELFFKIHSNIFVILTKYYNKIKINLWLTAPKGATPVNWTSATDWQMAVQRDNVTKYYKKYM